MSRQYSTNMSQNPPWNEVFYAPRLSSGWESRRPRPAESIVRGAGLYRIIEIVDGSYLVNSPENKQRLGPGSVLFVPPGAGPSLQRGLLTRENTVVFSVVYDADPQPQPEEVWGIRPPLVLEEPLAGQIGGSLRPILALWWLDPIRRLRGDALLGMLLATIVERCSQSRPEVLPVLPAREEIDPRILMAESLVTARLNSWKTSDMAAAVGMERSAFSRLYHRQRGEPPGALLQRARLSYAHAILSGPAPDLRHLAASIGFVGVSSFARWFQRSCGCSPMTWHRRCQQP